MGIAMIINVLLNVILIPKYTLAGAAVASIVSQGVMLGLGLYYANTVIKYNKKLLSIRLAQNIITASLMFLIVVFLRDIISWILILPIAGAFYAGFLFVIGGYSKEDLQSILVSVGIRNYLKTYRDN